MTDPRIKTLAHNLINYSCRLNPGENVLIESKGQNDELVNELIRETYRVGANPFVKLSHESIERELAMNCNKAQVELQTRIDSELMSNMQAYVGIRGGMNIAEMSDVPSKCADIMSSIYFSGVHEKIRVPKTKWVILRYPNPSMAQLANMSTSAFEDFFFNVCNLDYSKMDKAMQPLKELMERTDRVRLTGLGTDISFSIKGMPAIKCAGEANIPDGEIYSAPLKDSINGVISYNTPSLHDGYTFENIVLKFKNGRIIEATANDSERINHIFDIDPGARGVGEFAIGLNPYITSPMKDTLFDEKIAGSIHFTPGSCYDDCSNGNKSALHWDLVLIQRPEYGGGDIFFDDKLIRHNGLFTLPELEALNPENLK